MSSLNDQTERASRIQFLEKNIRDLSKAFISTKGVEMKDAAKNRQLFAEAYARIIEYYEQGGQLPTVDTFAYTFTGSHEVWRGTQHEMLAKMKEIGGYPISDLLTNNFTTT